MQPVNQVNRLCFDCIHFQQCDPEVSFCYCHNYEVNPLDSACPCFSLDTSIK